MGGKPGGPFTLHFFTECVRGIVFDTGVIQFVGADHAAEAHCCPERAFVGCIGEDAPGGSACIGSEGDGLKMVRAGARSAPLSQSVLTPGHYTL